MIDQDVAPFPLERLAHAGIARHGTAAQQRLVFPDPGLGPLVRPEALHARHERARLAVGTQPRIHLVKAAVARLDAQQVDQSLHEPEHEDAVIDGLRARSPLRLATGVMQEDHVQVGTVTQLQAAELAVTDDREAHPPPRFALAAHGRAMALGHLRVSHVQGVRQDQLGGVGEPVADLHQRQVRHPVGDRDPEHRAALKRAHDLELRFKVVGHAHADRLVQRFLQFLAGGRGVENALVEQFVEQQRMLFHQCHQELAAFGERQQPRQRAGIFADQRKIGAAPADGLQQRNEAADDPRRVPVLAQPQRQARHHFGQPLPRDFVHPAVQVAVAQAVKALRHGPGLAHALAFQQPGHVPALPRNRPALIQFRAVSARGLARTLVPAPAAFRGFAITAALAAFIEREPVELRFDELAMHLKFDGKRLPGGAAHRPGQYFPGFRVCGQALGLLVLHRLEAVFQRAQESIRALEFGDGSGLKDAGEFEPPQRLQQRTAPQRRVLPAPDQLKHLHDELDFADAARTELDVVGQVAPGHFVGDQRFHLA